MFQLNRWSRYPKKELSYAAKARIYEREFGKEFRVNPNYELFYELFVHSLQYYGQPREAFQESTSTENQPSIKDLCFLPPLPPLSGCLCRNQKEFKAKLVKTFLAADISLKKLQNSRVRELFTDLGQAVPSESACRAHVRDIRWTRNGSYQEKADRQRHLHGTGWKWSIEE